MPPKVKVTKQMVADAAFELIRESGHENLSARAIAERLGCSTQPVLYGFKTVDEIRQAAYEIADGYHTSYIMPGGTERDPMLALGLNYVRFGYAEKNLFRFLFQTNQFGGMDVDALLDDPNLSGVLEVMAKGLGCGTAGARELFLSFFCAAHGMASLLANNAMAFDEAQCAGMLAQVFYGMIASRKGEQNAETL